ncbi:unnamed protein product [Paramecium primaurelia]|uniref:Transmembrane protein 230 n=1 Tax=Paramecium primaurelia TaxID=5886 RepID=A0A8S1K3A1_PARPR|nr:unnamed protein product [Paramecium primaurelia]
MSNKRKHKVKQYIEIEINETYKDTPTSKHGDSQSNELDQTNNSIQQQEPEQKYKFNVIPLKVVTLTVFLFILGVIFVIFGLIFLIKNPKKIQQYLSLLIVGSLMIIPGLYYSCLLIKFIKADSRSVQEKILNELPID